METEAWFVSPYVVTEYGRGPARSLAIDEASRQIEAADGYWAEAEIAGDQAVVKVRGPKALLDDLSTTFEKVSDPSLLWEPTYKSEISGKTFNTLPIQAVQNDVLSGSEIGELKRKADDIGVLIERYGYVRLEGGWTAENRVLLQILGRRGYGLDKVSTGTFPTTGVIDDFNRANGAIGTNYVKRTSQASEMQINVNRATSNPTSYLSAIYNVASYSANQEVFVTIQTKGPVWDEGPGVLFRIAATTDDADYYSVNAQQVDAAADLWKIVKADAGVSTTLGSTIPVEYASGDKIGGEAIGSAISAYVYQSGAWTLVGSRTDTTYAGGGRIGFYCDKYETYMDDFGGGSVVSATLDNCLPDADVTTTGWTTAPLFSKVNDSSDSTVIQATAV